MSAGEPEELLRSQFQRTVGCGHCAEEGDAQQHDEEACSKAADDVGITVSYRRTENNGGQNRDESHVDLSDKADDNDQNQNQQGY